ncbi:MAG: hypothetical protein ACREDJ_07010 [Methylocella sp.]
MRQGGAVAVKIELIDSYALQGTAA